jgi:hypothetical protein
LRSESNVAEAHEFVDGLAFELFEDCLECGQISMDVGENSEEHSDRAA